jgi:hypothetical protein
MIAKQATHIRLPARSESVDGREQVPGKPLGAPTVLDPRTISQDPVKPKDATP